MESPAHLSRRRFIKGLAASGVLLGAGQYPRLASGSPKLVSAETPILSGTQFDLVVDESLVNFTGATRTAVTINGSIPAPTLHWREGDTVTLRVTNRLKTSTSIHWHGIILPFEMDGVPGISFKGIPPGSTFTYRFKVNQHGTYWYHSHTGFQEMRGMYGGIVITPRNGDHHRSDRDYVIQVSDWTDEDPMRVFANLKQQGDFYNFNQPTAADFTRDVKVLGIDAALAKRKMWNQMRMSPTDLADLSSHTLSYLLNGRTTDGNWTGIFKAGERLRLRFINGASNTFYDVRIPGLKLAVIAADGVDVDPVTVDEFRFGPGETYDVIVEPREDAYTVFAQSMDRTGSTRGTLAVRDGLVAPVPAMDPPEPLSMTDMMGAMTMGNTMAMDKMSMDTDKGAMNHGQDHRQHAMHQSAKFPTPSKVVNHARTEYGPSTDMRVNTPRTSLDDPGVGLRSNGRRVLTLSDLHTIGGPLDKRGAGREVELHLTGNMERYSWSFDGLEFGQSTPVSFKHGERLRVILQNDTMMTHPMHLHGLWSEQETAGGEFLTRRHTIPVQPAQRVSFLVTADALGRWAWHCHLAFHMDAGMFREVVVS